MNTAHSAEPHKKHKDTCAYQYSPKSAIPITLKHEDIASVKMMLCYLTWRSYFSLHCHNNCTNLCVKVFLRQDRRHLTLHMGFCLLEIFYELILWDMLIPHHYKLPNSYKIYLNVTIYSHLNWLCYICM